tara:strand:- start:33047 stop:34024 length:978 start_codon:yes stop_codon:yes gene_type:complete
MLKIFKDITTLIKLKINEKRLNKIFFIENENIYYYLKDYISKRAIVLFLNKPNFILKKNFYYFEKQFFKEFYFYLLNFKYFYTSTPNIGENICKKSLYKKTKYIYLQHSPVGLISAYNGKAFVNFDCVQAINKSQYHDGLIINKHFRKKIKFFKSRYKFIKNFKKNNQKKITLIAPTWGTDFYKDNFISKLIKILKNNNIKFLFRPHPMSIKKNEFDLNILNEFKDNLYNDPYLDFNKFDNLISDWSGIIIEFLKINHKSPILIKTKFKNNNEIITNYRSNSFEYFINDQIENKYNKNELNKVPILIKSNKLNNVSGIDFEELFF